MIELCELIDMKTHEVIVRDHIVFEKFNQNYISFDNKYFFNLNSKRFTYKLTTGKKRIPFNVDIIHNYITKPFRVNKRVAAEIYVERNENELDKEVEPLVHILNKIDGITTQGSCCGHNRSPLWVYMTATNLKSFLFLYNIITDDKFINTFDITLKYNNNSAERMRCIMLQITTKDNIIGKKAYQASDKLVEEITSRMSSINKKLFEVFDTKENKIIIRDFSVESKDQPIFCISFDGKHFFNSKSPRFIIKSTIDTNIIRYDPQIIDQYEVVLWKTVYENDNAEIYRDFSIDELDPEVEPLVHALNDLPGITTLSSCCGHGNDFLWVTMNCCNFNTLIFLVNMTVDDLFKDSCYIKFIKNDNQLAEAVSVKFELRTYDNVKGKQAYRVADLLTKYIKNQFNIFMSAS